MSIRALGRQFAAQLRNANKRYWPGQSEGQQGGLFLSRPEYRTPEAQKAANRSWMAGKKPASWGGSWWDDYHPRWDPQTGRFHQPPEQQSLF